MAYYSGQGDYYRGIGDPGLFDFLKKGVGAIAKGGLHLLKQVPKIAGGPIGLIGAAIPAVGGLFHHPSAPSPMGLTSLPLPTGGPPMLQLPPVTEAAPSGLPAIVQGIQQIGRGVLTPFGLGGGPGAPVPGKKPKQPRYTKKGKLTYRRKPHMHVTNVHALRRSVRRLKGFKKISTRVMRELGVHHRAAPRRRGRGDFYMGDGDA